jgi:hypothetical protein
MYKLLSLGVLFSGTMVALFSPQKAEALKLKIEPSISFRQSFGQTYYTPAPVYMRETAYVDYFVEDCPYCQTVYYYESPGYYYYPAAYPVPMRSSGTDFQLNFKLK